MSKLKKFNKFNKKNIMPLVVLCLVVAIMSAVISYAVYQKEDEVIFINAKVGQFETTNSDIELAMTLDGEDVDVPPSKGYYNVTVVCDNADGLWNTNKWLAEIENITSSKVKCNVNFETTSSFTFDILEIGDYISMIPTATSYTPPTSVTGLTNGAVDTWTGKALYQNTINPSELNLWRVIKKNDDGTVEAVSEYVSSIGVIFYGDGGYRNIVSGLNTVAAQYTNSKYVSSTRHMGYKDQVLTCSSNIAASCPADERYITDINLVETALGTLIGKTPAGDKMEYWIPSRAHYFSADYPLYLHRRFVRVRPNGLVDATNGCDGNGNDPKCVNSAGMTFSIRPIITLKKDIEIVSGNGKSPETAYQFSN